MRNLVPYLLCFANCLYAGHKVIIAGDFGCLPVAFPGCDACLSKPLQDDSAFFFFLI